MSFLPFLPALIRRSFVFLSWLRLSRSLCTPDWHSYEVRGQDLLTMHASLTQVKAVECPCLTCHFFFSYSLRENQGSANPSLGECTVGIEGANEDPEISDKEIILTRPRNRSITVIANGKQLISSYNNKRTTMGFQPPIGLEGKKAGN